MTHGSSSAEVMLGYLASMQEAEPDTLAVVVEGLQPVYREGVRAMARGLLAACDRVDAVEAALEGRGNRP